MSIAFILLYAGPVVLLLGLGAVSIYLTFNGFIPGRPYLGWGILVVTLAVFGICLGLHSRSSDINYGTMGLLFYFVFLSLLLIPQGPLVMELITLTVLPDPSKGLKELKVHTEAERLVIEDDLPGAIAEYEKIIAADPKDTDARLRLGQLCSEVKDYPKAAAVYEALLKYADEIDVEQHCSALTRLAEIHSQHFGDVNKARGFIETIIEKHPKTQYAEFARERLENL
jgi:tetratricopeptide (TPR) repeat protein